MPHMGSVEGKFGILICPEHTALFDLPQQHGVEGTHSLPPIKFHISHQFYHMGWLGGQPIPSSSHIHLQREELILTHKLPAVHLLTRPIHVSRRHDE